jgi:hypothetical protein
VATVAIVTAAVVVLAGGGDAFWLCLPPVLLVSALARTRAKSLISAAAVTAAAALPLTGWLRVGTLPDPALTLLVVAASVTVLVAVRERLERQHAALRSVAEGDR